MSDPDKLVDELIAKVAAKEKEIGKIEGYTPKTNMVLPNDVRGTQGTNLNTVGKVEELISLLAELKVRKDAFAAIVKEVGLKVPFTWGGKSYAAWESDIKQLINKLSLQQKKKSLAALRSRLDNLLSPEQKRQMEIAKISAELDGDGDDAA